MKNILLMVVMCGLLCACHSNKHIETETCDAHAHEEEHPEAKNANTISFTEEQRKHIDFSIEPCRNEAFGQVIKTMAQILPIPGDEQVVVAKSSGIVSFADVNMAEGVAVNSGHTLFYLSSEDMTDNNLTVRYNDAMSEYNRAKAEYERKQALFADKIVSAGELLKIKTEYDNAERTFQNLRRNYSSGRQLVSAPIKGYIKQVMVVNGEFVEAGQPLATVSQNQNLFIKASVQPKYYKSLQNIVSANFKIMNSNEVYTLESLGGKLVSYGKSLEPGNPLLPVLFQVHNIHDLLPGSFVETYIKTISSTYCITVSNNSLIEEMGLFFVYVQLTPELFEKREVKVGVTDGLRTEIVSGLKGTESVVAKGAILVKLAQSSGKLDVHSGHSH